MLVQKIDDVDRAQKEGKLAIIQTLPLNYDERLKPAFEKKYPFVKVDFHRANSRQIVQKWFTENEAKRFEADVVGGSEVTSLGKKAGLLARFTSPALIGVELSLFQQVCPP